MKARPTTFVLWTPVWSGLARSLCLLQLRLLYWGATPDQGHGGDEDERVGGATWLGPSLLLVKVQGCACLFNLVHPPTLKVIVPYQHTNRAWWRCPANTPQPTHPSLHREHDHRQHDAMKGNGGVQQRAHNASQRHIVRRGAYREGTAAKPSQGAGSTWHTRPSLAHHRRAAQRQEQEGGNAKASANLHHPK